jgi:hypothetical protein
MAAKSAELDKVLSGFPGMEQSEPVEDTEFVRFTTQLHIKPSDYHQSPRIFTVLRQSEFHRAKATPGALELLFMSAIGQHSFTDASSGEMVKTCVHKDPSGAWTAITIDGSIWEFHENEGRWMKRAIIP